jgi:hypothetical protein
MRSGIVHEGCREAELCSGCSMLAVEAMEAAWLLLSLAVRCSARSAHAARQPRCCHAPTVLSKNIRHITHLPCDFLMAMPVRRTTKTNRTRTVSSGCQSRPSAHVGLRSHVNAMPSLVSGYYNHCLQCGAHFVKLAFEWRPVSLSTVFLPAGSSYSTRAWDV